MARRKVTCPDCGMFWIAFMKDPGEWKFPHHYAGDSKCPQGGQVANEELAVLDG